MAAVSEVYLKPGEHHFGCHPTRIRTLLGSCVAVTLWHPQRRIGGMCHYMLPSRGRGTDTALDGRYADEALGQLAEGMARAGSRSDEYEAKLFGGGNMFPGTNRRDVEPVGARNIAAARQLLSRHGIRCVAEDVGGCGHRTVVFDLATGAAAVRRGPSAPAPTQCNDCEHRSTCLLR